MRTRAIAPTLQNHSLFALQHANMRSIIGDMEYRQTDGKTRRVHKQYVDVVARILAGGQVVPVTVCWVDGRCFTIDEIVSTTGFGLTVHGIRTATYKVRFGGHATELYLEDQACGRPDGSQTHVMRWSGRLIVRLRASAVGKDARRSGTMTGILSATAPLFVALFERTNL